MESESGSDAFDGQIAGINIDDYLDGDDAPGPSVSGAGGGRDAAYEAAFTRFMRNEIGYDEFMQQAGGISLEEEQGRNEDGVQPRTAHEGSEDEEYYDDDLEMVDDSMLEDVNGKMHKSNHGFGNSSSSGLPPDLARIMKEVMDENAYAPTDIHTMEQPMEYEESATPQMAISSSTQRQPRKLNKTLDALLGQANLMQAQGNTDEALGMLMEVIRQEPRNADAYRLVSDVYAEMGENEKSLQYGLLASYLDYKTPAGEWTRLGDLAEKYSCYEMASAAYARAIREENTVWSHYEKRLTMLDLLGQRPVAMKLRQQAAQMVDFRGQGIEFDVFRELIKHVAEYYIEINDEEKAVAALETYVLRAARHFGEPASTQHDTLVSMWIGKLKYREAAISIIALCHPAIRVVDAHGNDCLEIKVDQTSYDVAPFPLPADSRFVLDDSFSTNMLAKLLTCLIYLPGHRETNKRLLQCFLSRSLSDPSMGSTIIDIARALYSVDLYLECRRYCEAVENIESVSKDPALWFVYGNTLSALKEAPMAMEIFEYVLKLNPSHVDARINLSGLQAKAGMEEQALETLRDYDLEGCSNLPDERLLLRQAEFLFVRKQSEQFIRTARMLLTPYFYVIHRNPEVVTKKKRVSRANSVAALCTTLRQAALLAIQNTPLEKFVKRLGAVAYVEQSRSGEFGGGMDPSTLHDYSLKLIESLLGMGRYNDMLSVCCYAFLQPKIAKNDKSVTFQNLLYFCSIRSGNWTLAFEYVRWYHQSSLGNHPMLLPTDKETMFKRIFNAMNYVFCHSQNVSYHRYVMRALGKNPGNHALQTISGNNSLITGSYRHALGEFLRVWVENKNNPLICMLIGLTFTHMACKKDLSSRHMLCLRGLAFMKRYHSTRSASQEVFYNLGRTFHQLSVFSLAIHFYKKALAAKPPLIVRINEDGEEVTEHSERYDISRFAAHNLALLYASSGNIPLALKWGSPMFVLAVLQDTVAIKPHEFGKNVEETIERRINERLSNKVIPDLGLCIAFYDLIELGESALIPSDGRAHTRVKFRFIVFRPFVDEVIEAKVVGSNSAGLTLSVEFFEDIFVPADRLPAPNKFDEGEQVWHWEYPSDDGEPPAKLFMDPGKVVRFKVVENIFKDLKPDISLEDAKREKSYEIIGAMNETGLGCTAWWETEEAEEAAEDEEMDEGEQVEEMTA